jgi:alanine racemase
MPVASWLELSERAYAANVTAFRAVVGQARVGAVLKGNAYGHGLHETLSLAHGKVEALRVCREPPVGLEEFAALFLQQGFRLHAR